MGFRNDGVQVAEYDYDFAVDGGATGTFTLSSKKNKGLLPDGAVITKVVCKAISAVTGAAASASIGNTGSSTVFMAARDVDGVGALGLTADQTADYTTLLVANSANTRNVTMSVTGGAITAGKVKVMVQYLLCEV